MAVKIDKPTKLTAKVIEVICGAVELGASYEIAAAQAGVSYPSVRNWLNNGADARAKLEDEELPHVRKYTKAHKDIPQDERPPCLTEGERLQLEFLEAVEQAASTAALVWLKTIDDAATVDPQWAAWMLRNRYPREYGGGKQQLELSSPADQPLQVQHSGGVDVKATLETPDAERITGIVAILQSIGVLQPGAVTPTGAGGDAEADEVHPDSSNP